MNAALRPHVQMCDINLVIPHAIDAWKAACGFPTDNAAAMALRVDRQTIPRWRRRELTQVECLAMAAVYHRFTPFDGGMSDWMRACGFGTDSAAADAMGVDRHTVANWRARDLSHAERLALAAMFHRVKPFGY